MQSLLPFKIFKTYYYTCSLANFLIQDMLTLSMPTSWDKLSFSICNPWAQMVCLICSYT